MFSQAVNTNNRSVWHRLTEICDASLILWGCEPLVWGGVWRWSLE